MVTVGLRFAHLDRRVYWHDEVHTSIRAAGYVPSELIAAVYDGPIFSARQLQTYQQPTPGRSWGYTFNSPSARISPPLYFLIGRVWMLIGASSPGAMRALPAAISLLTLPAIYWLARGLFRRRMVAIVAVGLMSVSPMFVLLARESRHYSLWVVITLAASGAFVNALHHSSRANWILYVVTLALGLYSHLFFLFVMVAHGAYLLLTYVSPLGAPRPNPRTVRAYAGANLMALIVWMPWVASIIPHVLEGSGNVAWTATSVPTTYLLRIWGARYSGVFVDLDSLSDLVQLLFGVPVLLLAVYSFTFMWRRGPRDGRLFVLLLAAVPVLALATPDLLLGGWRSAVARYLVPVFISLQLAVAFLLGSKLAQLVGWRRTGWLTVTVALLVIGLVSSLWAVRATAWWDKGSDYGYAKIVRVINEANRPLVIISERRGEVIGRALSIANGIDPEAQMLWAETVTTQTLDAYSDVFVFRPIASMRQSIEATSERQLEPVVSGLLWRVSGVEE